MRYASVCAGIEAASVAWLEEAVEQLNKVIRAHRHEPLSWSAGKQRVVLPDER